MHGTDALHAIPLHTVLNPPEQFATRFPAAHVLQVVHTPAEVLLQPLAYFPAGHVTHCVVIPSCPWMDTRSCDAVISHTEKVDPVIQARRSLHIVIYTRPPFLLQQVMYLSGMIFLCYHHLDYIY